jgi:hypothetical protein
VKIEPGGTLSEIVPEGPETVAFTIRPWTAYTSFARAAPLAFLAIGAAIAVQTGTALSGSFCGSKVGGCLFVDDLSKPEPRDVILVAPALSVDWWARIAAQNTVWGQQVFERRLRKTSRQDVER